MTDDQEPTQWVPPASPSVSAPQPEPPLNPYAPGSPYGQPAYGQSSYGRFAGYNQPVQPPPSQALAGWALGLSFVPCVITLLLSIIFAIVSLVRSTDQRDYGRRKSIAALCIFGAWVAVFITAVVVGVVDDFRDDADRNSAGEIESAGELRSSDLQVGDCYLLPEEGRVLDVEARPCAEPHEAEVFHTFELGSGSFPGENEVDRLATQGCLRAFSEFVGLPFRRSKLDLFYFFPDSKSWALGDREVICSVYEPTDSTYTDQKTISGTLRGANR